jgi:hypothetical protein
LFCIGHNNSEDPIGRKHSVAVMKQSRDILARVNVLKKMLDSESAAGSIGKRQPRRAVPGDNTRAVAWEQIQVYEALNEEACARYIGVDILLPSQTSQPEESPREEPIQGTNAACIEFKPEDVEREPTERQFRD